MQMYGYHIAFSHQPLSDDDSFDLNIHGHHHNTLHHPEDDVNDKHKLVFIEHEYKPIMLKHIIGK